MCGAEENAIMIYLNNYYQVCQKQGATIYNMRNDAFIGLELALRSARTFFTLILYPKCFTK